MDSTIGLCRRRRRWDPAAWSTLSILGLLAISLTDITSGLPGILRASSDETSESVQSAVESGARWSIFDKTNAVALAHQQRNEVRRQAYIRSLIGRLDYLKGEGEDFYNVKLAKTQRRRNSIEKEFTKQELEEVLEDIDDVQFSSQPRGIGNGTLKDYQIDFINWMSRLYNRGVSGILADEMGLGKTVQAVTMVSYLREYLDISGYHLVVVPKSTMSNWEREFRTWAPKNRLLTIMGNRTERAAQLEVMRSGQFDTVLTSYEILLREKGAFRHVFWRFFVVDEAHRLKNDQSKLATVMREFQTNCRLLLTGTPLQNNLRELWSLLNFLMPQEFPSSEAFEKYFNISSDNASQGVTRRLHSVLRPFMLRRLKAEVAKSVPARTEINVYVPLSVKQRTLYRNILRKDTEAISGTKADKSSLLNIVMQLRKACNHPYLFHGQEPGPPFVSGEHLIQASGKLRLLDRLLERLKVQGSRVLIFSQMSRMLDILEDYANFRDYKYSRIDGSIGGIDREEQIDAFMNDKSDKFLFLLSTRAGGLGLNLQKADQVVIFDSDWNPQADIQAMNRAHRIGQTKNVTVYRLIQEGTVEEKVVERAFSKLFLDALIMQRGSFTSQKSKPIVSQGALLDMVRFGADQVMHADSKEDIDIQVDKLLAAGQKRTMQLTQSLRNMTNQLSASNFSFDGRDISELFENRNLTKASEVLMATTPKQENPFIFDIGRRERKPNLAVANYLKEIRQEAERKALKKESKFEKYKKPYVIPKLPKSLAPVSFPEYQLFDKEKIDQLITKKRKWWYSYQKALKDKWDRSLKNHKLQLTSELRVGRIISREVDANEGLTDKENATLNRFLELGFPTWTKRDFTTFRVACERRGRHAIALIAQDIGKPIKEVQLYSTAFWEKGPKKIHHWVSIKKAIERGEAAIRKRDRDFTLVSEKLMRYERPLRDLELQQSEKDQWPWSASNDRFILVAGHQCYKDGVDYMRIWDVVLQMVHSVPKFRNDLWMRTQTANGLQARFTQLIRMLQRSKKTTQDTPPPVALVADGDTRDIAAVDLPMPAPKRFKT
ncbi:hypothetical protein AAMO2058_000015700 [Amorphochlora amoebiformis]|uniref:Uncharacterized protein n=1 Tax=Amorphochlora amoebiformis TaxID=1561963 RepID=A0A7S0H0W6_9EUKA|mmetsp:Transcript_22925/g.35996  ORF Transcript_22925/g.35996 Transcript_22925/m.35996 type:complete len:1059 (+) Transcript_22925:132-3308(+)